MPSSETCLPLVIKQISSGSSPYAEETATFIYAIPTANQNTVPHHTVIYRIKKGPHQLLKLIQTQYISILRSPSKSYIHCSDCHQEYTVLQSTSMPTHYKAKSLSIIIYTNTQVGRRFVVLICRLSSKTTCTAADTVRHDLCNQSQTILHIP